MAGSVLTGFQNDRPAGVDPGGAAAQDRLGTVHRLRLLANVEALYEAGALRNRSYAFAGMLS
jgi:hypothetical protein